ncbi:hypothetical protein IFM89_005086 [Coptis chinensis]|uniref:DNA-directed RNA polymerase subunit n=1 Tax=Coptis chinensis TaxID=261450 RepID=A0A835M7B1_9MAGN|nr:hypothetical protein IFM89_005086 [Coptis chinensis]
MFFLSLIEHTLRLPPHLLNLPLDQAIKGELETLFWDKVIANLGLCVSIYDIRNIDGGFIFPGDGASTFTVNFRWIMFRPFVGEVLSGEVEESDAKGLRLSLGFFKEITLPAHLLPNPSKFGEDGKWTWDFNGTELPIEKEDEIHFKVHSIRYPPIPVEQEKDVKPFAPMVITASIDFDGLGPISWWV